MENICLTLAGGKNFIFAHSSASVKSVTTALIRGAFEFSGQKCSACSRGYIPASIWPQVKSELVAQLSEVKLGNPEDPATFVGAVIHKNSFDKIRGYIDYAKSSSETEIIFGGEYNHSIGYFIQPTVVKTTNPHNKLLKEEIFGPVLTVYVYEDADFLKTLKLCDTTVEYGLTGSIFANDIYAIAEATREFQDSSGNFYINDKVCL
jgi:1-pyrroline-5-carboxylate dehydrogenase